MIHTVLITRPHPAAEELAAELTCRGYQPVISPMLEIVETDTALPDQQGFDALLLTSPSAVRIYAARTQQRDLPVYAVGDATAKAAVAAGFMPVHSADGAGADLDGLIAQDLPHGSKILHPRGEQVAHDFSATAQKYGFDISACVLYRTQAPDELPQALVTSLRERTIDAVMFLSSATAAAFVRLFRAAGLDDESCCVTALCLSDAIAEQASGLQWKETSVAARPKVADLLDLLDDLTGLGKNT